MNKVYEIISDQILSILEEGDIPWKKPWKGTSMPTNLKTGKPYRGVNVMLLWAHNYESDFWVTFRQAKKLGGGVNKGASGRKVVFWRVRKRIVTVKDEDGNPALDEDGDEIKKEKKKFILRYYTVFNVDQCYGLEEKLKEKTPDDEENLNPIESAEQVIEQMKKRPKIEHIGSRAFYSPKDDKVTVPKMKTFSEEEGYYSVMFHELAHSTGHSSRLNRGRNFATATFGSEDYGKEELVAEMASAFVLGSLGLAQPVIENQAAYIRGWKKAIKDDRKLVIIAGSQAGKAADYILDSQNPSGEN